MPRSLKLTKFKSKLVFYLLVFFLNLFFLIKLESFELNGIFKQGGLAYGKVKNENLVFFDSKKILVHKDGSFIIGFSRNNKASSLLRVEYENGKIFEKTIIIKKRKYNTQKINNLEQTKVIPPKSYYDRIKTENALIRQAKNRLYNFPYYKSGFIIPAKGVATGVYGTQRVLNGIPKRPHYGIDIANKKGTAVLAPADGIVVLSEKDLYFSGGTIIISHGLGVSSSLLHLSKLLVKVGETVSKGDKVGLMGSSGRSTGPHLDWRMDVSGVRIDPQIVLDLQN